MCECVFAHAVPEWRPEERVSANLEVTDFKDLLASENIPAYTFPALELEVLKMALYFLR